MSEELIKFQESYPVLKPGSEAAELIAFNLKDATIGPGDLDKITVPSGGGTIWEVPTFDGAEGMKSIKGIIVHKNNRRAYWATNDPSGDPPDCSSQDCVHGEANQETEAGLQILSDNPNMLCKECPLNQWGSATDDSGAQTRGKACKETTQLFILREGENLPNVVSVPPGSLANLKKYLLKLPVKYFYCVTELSLESDKNDRGTKFSKINFKLADFVDDESREAVAGYAESMSGVLSQVGE